MPWGGVTEPSRHIPTQFRYLIHAIDPGAGIEMALMDAVVMKDRPDSIDKSKSDQTISLFSQPELLDKRVTLSCSLIDQDHYGNWGRGAGLIVEAPPENVIVASPEDAGTALNSKELLKKKAMQGRLLTAEQLLQETDPSTHNEIVVLANEKGRKITLVGFFYKTTEDGMPIGGAVYNEMRLHARRLSLPFIPIIEPNPYADNEIIHTGEQFLVHYGGRHYVLQDSPRGRFRSYGQSGSSVFATPHEMEQVFSYLQENNVDEQEIEQLRTEYMEADKARQQPRVRYDDQGNVASIEKTDGYGAGESQIRVSGGGYISKVNVVKEAKNFSRMTADPEWEEDEEFGDSPYMDVSPSQAGLIVREAIRNAPKDEKERLEQWWNNVQKKGVRLIRGSLFR